MTKEDEERHPHALYAIIMLFDAIVMIFDAIIMLFDTSIMLFDAIIMLFDEGGRGAPPARPVRRGAGRGDRDAVPAFQRKPVILAENHDVLN